MYYYTALYIIIYSPTHKHTTKHSQTYYIVYLKHIYIHTTPPSRHIHVYSFKSTVCFIPFLELFKSFHNQVSLFAYNLLWSMVFHFCQKHTNTHPYIHPQITHTRVIRGATYLYIYVNHVLLFTNIRVHMLQFEFSWRRITTKFDRCDKETHTHTYVSKASNTKQSLSSRTSVKEEPTNIEDKTN